LTHAFGVPGQARPALDEAIDIATRTRNDLSGNFALMLLGLVSYYEGDFVAARGILRDSASRTDDLPYGMAAAAALALLALVLVEMNHHDDVDAVASQLETTASTTGAHGYDSFPFLTRGLVALDLGDHAQARALLDDALAAISLPYMKVSILEGTAELDLVEGAIGRALTHTDAIIELAQELAFPYGAAVGLALKARVERAAGDASTAEQAAHDGLRIASELGATAICIDVLETSSGLALDAGDTEAAARLLGAAEAAREQRGYARRRFGASTLAPSLQDVLSGEFELLRRDGRVLSLDDAISYAQANLRNRAPLPPEGR